MIVTFTPNPSIDITLSAPGRVHRGAVERMTAATTVAGGKGINVARALHTVGVPVVALFPADPQDLFLRLLATTRTPFEVIPTDQQVRVNTAVCEPDGTTTKLNGPGGPLDADAVAAATELVALRARRADWVVLAGSLPPGAPVDWYVQLTDAVKTASPGTRVAVDTSGAALEAVMDAMIDRRSCRPDLLKPNATELRTLAQTHPAIGAISCPEQAALSGDMTLAATTARQIACAGRTTVLASLGAAGAVLATPDQRHHTMVCPAPAITVKSTVGAGDCTLAGFLHATITGASPAEALASAVAHGSAAATLPGTHIPTPSLIATMHTSTTELQTI